MQKTLQEKREILPENLAYADELLLKWERDGRAGKTTLFIGDSFFDARWFWTDFYQNAFAEIDAIAAGIGGTTTYDWAQLALTFLSKTSPKNLVVNLGTNNFYDDFDTEAEALFNLQSLLRQLKALLPNTKIYYFAIAQRTDETYKAEVARTNAAMQNWCACNGVAFLSVTDRLTPETLRDGVHPKLESYALYLAALRQAGIGYETK